MAAPFQCGPLEACAVHRPDVDLPLLAVICTNFLLVWTVGLLRGIGRGLMRPLRWEPPSFMDRPGRSGWSALLRGRCASPVPLYSPLPSPGGGLCEEGQRTGAHARPLPAVGAPSRRRPGGGMSSHRSSLACFQRSGFPTAPPWFPWIHSRPGLITTLRGRGLQDVDADRPQDDSHHHCFPRSSQLAFLPMKAPITGAVAFLKASAPVRT